MSLDAVPLAVSHTLENAIGLLQNISLKPAGIDKILHFKPAQDQLQSTDNSSHDGEEAKNDQPIQSQQN